MKQEEYQQYISRLHDARKDLEPEGSIVIGIYNTDDAILELLSSLKEQSVKSFEIIIINNGKIPRKIIDLLLKEPILYIENTRNSISLARNIGAVYARSDIVIFLDDDCLAHTQLVQAHIEMYANPAILTVQGRVVAKRAPFYSHFQSHYDLGPAVVPAFIGLEGNSSLRKSVLENVGGFDPELFGAEGLELSYRIVEHYKRPEALVYSPDPLIYHDFAAGVFDYLEKCYRQPKMRKRIANKFPHIIAFAKNYGPSRKPAKRYSFPLEKVAAKTLGLFGAIAEKLGRYSA